MREIKFRGQRVDTKEWVYGYYVKYIELVSESKGCYITEFLNKKHHYIYDNFGKRFDVIPSTVGQYTGLKDKNDVELYDGDVVKVDYSPVDDSDLFEIKFGTWGNDRYNISTIGFYLKDYKYPERCFNEHPIDQLIQNGTLSKLSVVEKIGTIFDKED